MNLVSIDDTTEPIQDIRYIQEQLDYGFVNLFDHLKSLPFYNRTPRNSYYDSKRFVIEKYQDLVTDFKAVALTGNIFPWYTIEKMGFDLRYPSQ
jgi:hypothetical protein